jgi:hypothetical protein
MGNDYSYPDNAERKRLGYRYDNPITSKYINAISSNVFSGWVGLVKPIDDIALDDLKHATFKSMLGNSDPYVRRLAADNIMVKNTLVLTKQQYEENRDFYDCVGIFKEKLKYSKAYVKKVGDYFYVTNKFEDMDYAILVFENEDDVKKLNDLVFKVAEQIPDFELILPRKTLEYYRAPSQENGILIPSTIVPQLLKAKIKFGKTCSEKPIIKQYNGLLYKKLTIDLDTTDPDEYIIIKHYSEVDHHYFKIELQTELQNMGLKYEDIIDPPPPKYVEPPPPEYTEPELVTPSAPPKKALD